MLQKKRLGKVFTTQGKNNLTSITACSREEAILPAFKSGDILSYTASSTKLNPGPDGYRVLNKKGNTFLEEAIQHYSHLRDLIANKAPLFINAYPASITHSQHAVTIDSYMSQKTLTRAFQLAHKKKMPIILLGQPLFVADFLFSYAASGHLFPGNGIIVTGGYLFPKSLKREINRLLKAHKTTMRFVQGYGVAEVDAGLFYSSEYHPESGDALYHPRQDVSIKIKDVGSNSFGKLFVALKKEKLEDLSFFETGDLIKREGNAYRIQTSPKKVEQSVINILETWTQESWKRKTGYLAQGENNQLYFQLRKNVEPEDNSEISFYEYHQKFDFSWLEKPKWNFSNQKTNAAHKENKGLFFNQFHCLSPKSSNVKNFIFTGKSERFLFEEIRNPIESTKQIKKELKIAMQEVFKKSLGNDGLSGSVLDEKLRAKKIGVLRNQKGNIVGISSLDIFEGVTGKPVSNGVHLIDSAQGQGFGCKYIARSLFEELSARNSDEVSRVFRTHSPAGIAVSGSSMNEALIKKVKLKYSIYFREWVGNVHYKSEIEVLQKLFSDGFIKTPSIKLPLHLLNKPEKLLAFARGNKENIEFNLTKTLQFKNNSLPLFEKFDQDLRTIFRDLTKSFRDLIIERQKLILGDKINDPRHFDKDYFIHKASDPAYNMSKLCDSKDQDVNDFMKGLINYQRGDILVFADKVSKKTLLNILPTGRTNTEDGVERIPGHRFFVAGILES